MALLTKDEAMKELQEAEVKMKLFLTSVLNTGSHIPLNSSDIPNSSISVMREIDNFKNANWEEKFNLMRSYHSLYQNKNLNPHQEDLLSQANMSVLIGRFVFMGIPTEVAQEEPVKKMERIKQDIKKNNYEEAVKYIEKLRNMPNLNKCEYQGRSLQSCLSSVQFRSNQTCTQKELDIIKRAYENLDRYNHAIDIVAQLEKKSFQPAYHQEFAYKIAQTLKESKGICSEAQLEHLIKARDKLVVPEVDQMDIFSFAKGNEEKGKVERVREEVFSR